MGPLKGWLRQQEVTLDGCPHKKGGRTGTHRGKTPLLQAKERSLPLEPPNRGLQPPWRPETTDGCWDFGAALSATHLSPDGLLVTGRESLNLHPHGLAEGCARSACPAWVAGRRLASPPTASALGSLLWVLSPGAEGRRDTPAGRAPLGQMEKVHFIPRATGGHRDYPALLRGVVQNGGHIAGVRQATWAGCSLGGSRGSQTLGARWSLGGVLAGPSSHTSHRIPWPFGGLHLPAY